MNLVVAFILVLLTLLCMILIPNKLIAVAVILLAIFVLLLSLNSFKLNKMVVSKNNSNNILKNTKNNNEDTNIVAANENSIGLSNLISGIDSNFMKCLSINDNDMEEIGNILDDINWGNLFNKSLEELNNCAK